MKSFYFYYISVFGLQITHIDVIEATKTFSNKGYKPESNFKDKIFTKSTITK